MYFHWIYVDILLQLAQKISSRLTCYEHATREMTMCSQRRHAEKWKVKLAERRSVEGNCEILRTIFQPRTLSSDITASRKGVYLFYNPPNNFSRRAHVDRSCIFCGFFFVCFSVRNCQPAFYLSVFYLSVTGFFCQKVFFRFSLTNLNLFILQPSE